MHAAYFLIVEGSAPNVNLRWLMSKFGEHHLLMFSFVVVMMMIIIMIISFFTEDKGGVDSDADMDENQFYCCC